MTPENVYTNPDGARCCRECRKIAKYRARRKKDAQTPRLRSTTPRPSVEQRFYAKVMPHEQCLIWQGTVDRNGRPKFCPDTGTGRTVLAYRWAYEFTVGPIPEGLTLHHTCFRPRCVNPDHLVPMSAAENSRLGRNLDVRDTGVPRRRPTEEERFVRLVDKRPGGCWLWRGGFGRDRYGKFGKTSAHRWSYQHFRGLIPDGMHVDHRCRVPECVNPEHLQLLTAAENNRQRNVAKPRRDLCQRGLHPMTEENIYVQPSAPNRRACKACKAAGRKPRPGPRKRIRRTFTDDFRAEVVAYHHSSQQSLRQTARDLGLHHTVLSNWLRLETAAANTREPGRVRA